MNETFPAEQHDACERVVSAQPEHADATKDA